jgi:putative toxin-antitoxin system antitoxin component (TIGR02293 family)
MSAVRKRFQKLDLENKLSVAYSARKGVKTSIFYSFAEAANMPEKNLAGLIHLHQRTIQNYKDQNKSLDPVESEHLLKLIGLYMKGEETFGSVDEFNSWLAKPFWNSKEKPLEWLTTPGGVDLVSDELDRIAQGYVV